MKRCRSPAGAAAAEATQLSSTNTTSIAATATTTTVATARKNAQWGRHTGHSMRLPAHPIL